MKTHAEEILKIIDKNKDILEKEYYKPDKPKKINIYESLDKTKEIKHIYKMKIDSIYTALKYEEIHKEYLEGFLYLDNIQQIENNNEKLFVRYVNVNGKFGYGGFLYKYNNNSITLINSEKKPWTILIKENFIWYRRATTANDKMREEFAKFLDSNI